MAKPAFFPINTIRKRQRKWIGHILRVDLLLRSVMEGKERRGRQMMLDRTMTDGYGKLKEEAQQQEEWRRHAAGHLGIKSSSLVASHPPAHHVFLPIDYTI